MRISHSSSFKIVVKIALILICCISLLIYTKLTDRVSFMIYDQLLVVKHNPASSDITIIEVDDKTLKHLGNLPSNDINAKFIQKLFYLSPNAVIIDETFKLDLQKESVLKSITSIKNLYLPVSFTHEANLDLLDKYYQSTTYTEKLLNDSGHFILNFDGDSRVRSIDIQKDLNYKNISSSDSSSSLYAVFNAYQKSTVVDTKLIDDIYSKKQIFIPYNSSNYHKISYIDVLKNQVDPFQITGKYIIIGQNTQYVQKYNTPYGLMNSVDIHAQALQGFLDHTTIYKVDTIWQYLIAVVSIISSILIIWLCMPKIAVALNFLLISFLITINVLCFYYNWWFSPLPSIIGILAAYPMWIHYKMVTMTRFIDGELSMIKTSSLNLMQSLNNSSAKPWFKQDTFDRRISQLRTAIANNENMRQFIDNNINAMPDVIIVTDLKGNIILNNQAAETWLNHLSVKNNNMTLLLSTMSAQDLLQPKLVWQDIFEQAYNNPEQWQKGIELKIDTGKFKYGLLRIIPSNNHIGKMISWLCTIQDLTEKKHMEQQRDEMMRFLSHDMRSPQSSIIASIELHRKNKDYKSSEEILLKKIESHAYRTLTLAEEFVQLAKAEAQVYNNEYVSMSNLVMDSADDMWSLAKQKNIKIKQELIDDAYVLGDRLLLSRCITNLLSNAIKYTFENRQVWVKMSIRDNFAVVDFIDEGPGISKENQKKLFERFVRFEETKHVEGIGLGLSFVKVVVDKHNGKISCTSEYGHGCQFSILLPLAPPDEVV